LKPGDALPSMRALALRPLFKLPKNSPHSFGNKTRRSSLSARI